MTEEPAAPAERRLLAEVVSACAAGTLPRREWQEVRARLERRVWRVAAAEGVVYVKLQLYRSFRVRFRYAFKRSPLAAEARGARRLRAAGLQAPVPLLRGEEGWGFGRRRSVLVTREVAGIPPAAALSGGSLALADLASLLVLLARAGACHPDLHLGNLLATQAGPAVLDLQSVRFPLAGLGAGPRLRMAAKLGLDLEAKGLAGPGSWSAALAAAGFLPGPLLGARLPEAMARVRRREVAARVRRCLMESSGFARECWEGGRLYRKRRVPREAILAAARQALARGGEPGLLGGWTVSVGPARRLRRAWVDHRFEEVAARREGPALALVVAGRRACLLVEGACGASSQEACAGSESAPFPPVPGGDGER